MRKLLITINVILGAFLLWGFSKNIAAHSNKNSANQLKLLPLPKAAKSENTKRSGVAPLADVDESAKKIIAHDVFNNVRSPLANVRSSRTQLTLVGIFRCGKSEGAIIRQNNQFRQFNPYLAQMMAQGGMMNRPGMMGNRGGMMNRPGMMGGNRFTSWSQVSGRSSGAEKQYVKVGETLSNGYTLAEVTRTGATLIRGNDRIELELQEPSRNRNNRGGNNNFGRRPGLNSTQQFQQAQMIMQGQMMRTMQQMQQTIQSNRNQGGGNRGGFRR